MAHIAAQAWQPATAQWSDPVKAVSSAAVFHFAVAVEARTQAIDGHLTDIVLAQDFHDLSVSTQRC